MICSSVNLLRFISSVLVGAGLYFRLEGDSHGRSIGIRVQGLRKKRGLSQEGLAEAIERSTDTVSNIERGFSSTQIITMFQIAGVLGISMAELFDVGPPRPLDRERRKLIDQLLELIAAEDSNTIEAVIAQAEILLRVKARTAKMQRLRT